MATSRKGRFGESESNTLLCRGKEQIEYFSKIFEAIFVPMLLNICTLLHCDKEVTRISYGVFKHIIFMLYLQYDKCYFFFLCLSNFCSFFLYETLKFLHPTDLIKMVFLNLSSRVPNHGNIQGRKRI